MPLFTNTNFLNRKQLIKQVYSVTAGYDADAQAYFDAIVSNGGTISTASKGYVNTFVLAAKSKGYWSKLLRINLFCGDQLAACLVPLKIGGGNTTDTNTNFVGGDYAESTGLKGNGSSKYLSTGIIPSSMLTLNDTHQAVYNRSSTGGGACGCSSGGGANFMRIYAPYGADGKVYDDHNGIGAGRLATASAIGTPYGHLIGDRASSTDHRIYRNGSSIANNATQDSARPNNSWCVFASDDSGTVGNYMDSYLAAYSIGSSLGTTDAANYYTDLQALQTSLGRNV